MQIWLAKDGIQNSYSYVQHKQAIIVILTNKKWKEKGNPEESPPLLR